MKAELKLGALSAKAGERVYGVQDLNLDGHTTHVPVFLINGALERPDAGRDGGNSWRRVCKHRGSAPPGTDA